MAISKPFTGYTAADYATVVGVGLTRFFRPPQRAIGEMAVRYAGHVVKSSPPWLKSLTPARPRC